MDIAQYIALFLVKNEYCYLPGIGSLQVKKMSAQYDSESERMDPPEYKVVYSKTAGSIDDAFANFIANNERISINHAANFFKDYCSGMKEDLKQGKEITIPGIGYFHKTGENIEFTTDPALKIKGKSIPFFKVSAIAEKNQEESISQIIDKTTIKEPKGDEEIIMKAPQVNWIKIIILAVVALAILGVIIYFIAQPRSNANTTTSNTQVIKDAEPTPQEAREEMIPEAPASPEAPAAATSQSFALINNYPSEDRANKRIAQLKSYGHHVELLQKDSNNFNVVIPIPLNADTNHFVDSLNKIFGGNIRIIQ